ncbi:MAG: citrate synthase [Clostridiales bacterium]|nr:citrate synthase [Clostridiales bacterium]
MSNYHSPISNDELKLMCEELLKHSYMEPGDFEKYNVKRGLRNADGTGVMAGLTHVCSVEGYYINDGERVPKEGRLYYRGVDMRSIVEGCEKENRFGYEEVAWLLMLGYFPGRIQLERFKKTISSCMELPEDFAEDMIMKAPSNNIMNKMARSVLALYSYDENPDDTSIENVLRQSVQLLAQLPTIMAYAYQVKRRHFYKQTMYLHPIIPSYGMAETILHAIRADGTFKPEEAKLLDTCMMLHAEHGGGNNSAFAARVLSSSGTDTYSAISAAIGALKGPRHGGANIKAANMIQDMRENISDITNEGQVADYLAKIINKEAGDHSGLIYGMGHAVYTLSDPRAKILKEKAREFSENTEFREEFELISLVERLTPAVFSRVKGQKKRMCANVDLYSGFVYKMLGIPEDLYTPLFVTARVAGWSAHRMEELITGGRIMRPAYKNVSLPRAYIPIDERAENYISETDIYIPSEERD